MRPATYGWPHCLVTKLPYGICVTDLRQATQRLRRAAQTGELAALCRRHGITLLVLFGSAGKGAIDPHDLDLALESEYDSVDLLGFLDEVSEIAGTSKIDLMNLRRAGPVARERALVGTVPLVEAQTGAFARAQLAAIMERLDTDWLRRMELELLANGR